MHPGEDDLDPPDLDAEAEFAVGFDDAEYARDEALLEGAPVRARVPEQMTLW